MFGASRAARPILMKGNEAMAEAAIEAGCDAYFGYPITPQAELLERMARRMPELGRVLNSSLIEAEPSRADIEVLRVPCSVLAREVGDERVISIVALAAAMARRPIVSPTSIRRAVVALARKGGPELVERNLRALEAGKAHGLVQATLTMRA